ncbi:MAG TPA: FBP domain-containing protein [Candidatus Saccharimonadales bacterium]
MKNISRDELSEILRGMRISRRLVRDLRFVPEEISYVNQRDFLAVYTKSGTEGVLLYKDMTRPFELKKRMPNSSGRVEAVICDICATWQRGTNSAMLTLYKDKKHTISHLVCADLDCSLHVRDLTDESKLSRTQLREHLTPEARIARLEERLTEIMKNVG